MLDTKNASGWALLLVALGLFIGLISRDMARKELVTEPVQAIATMVPASEDRARSLRDLGYTFQQVASKYASVIAKINVEPLARLPEVSSRPYFESPKSLALRGPSIAPSLVPMAMPDLEPTGIGSAVVFREDGYLLTNYHIVGNAGHVIVSFKDKRKYLGSVVGTDPLTNLAVIKIPADELKMPRLGDSDHLRPGQWVLAIGHPYEEQQALAAGIVCVKGRSNVWLAETEDFIQTDATINAWNSGGALIDLNGKVVGINSARTAAGETRGSFGMAVPINMARQVFEHILTSGGIGRSTLGLEAQDLDEALALALKLKSTEGALVTAVTAGAPAEVAGMRRGDVVVKFAEKVVKSSMALRSAAAWQTPGSAVPVEVMRDSTLVPLQVILPELSEKTSEPKPGEAPTVSNWLGLNVKPLTTKLKQEGRIPSDVHGVLITHVAAESPAALAGIRSGDVIQEMNRRVIAGPRDFQTILGQLRQGETALILLWRRSGHFYTVAMP